ncbi:hypothetical protein ACFQZX_13535 [Mucilaginibacter litoreus]|uniref:Zinc-finger n=1 Tax=Mucilaginibacter litoreus TaxID=1048221 RepID=A0ABW3AUA2_9SPHI
MNSIEERLWNYIDGTCTDQERQAIARLIERDEAYRNKYNELLLFNESLNNIELDEPSMAFTYNVMESVRIENASQPLKAAINKKIIWSIAVFFIATVAGLLVYTFSTVNWSAGTDVDIPVKLNVPRISSYLTGPVIKGFLFFDIVMGLFLLDSYLRRVKLTKQQ